MSNSPIIADDATTGGGTTIIVQGEKYPVSAGYGMLFGNAAGATPRDIILEGGLIALSPLNGKFQSPVISTIAQECVVATATITASATTATLIPIATAMDECEFTIVSFRRFSGTSPAGMQGGIYAAEPVNGVWSDQAAIIPVTDIGNIGGFSTKRVICYQQLREATALWYRPVTNGPSGLTFDVQILGVPRWKTIMPKPYVPTPT